MLEQTDKSAVESPLRHSHKPDVWRDSALGLAASIGVGFLTGTALTLVVFTIVAIAIGQ
jgi:hypothetical protein